MPHAVLEKPQPEAKEVLPDVPPPDLGREPRPTASGGVVTATILLLTISVFLTDLHEPETYHVGVLYVICIALTLWSWNTRWVIGITAATFLLRVIGHGLELGFSVANFWTSDMLNLMIGLSVQTLTGALIWRQVLVQHRLEEGERYNQVQAKDLEVALVQARQATEEAREATRREREARLREVEARRREKKSLEALERVRDLSAALSRAVLPVVPPEIADGRMRLAARYTPAERDIQIGGDFYDVVALDETQTRYALVIGDVAGHGVEAAAQTALVTSTLRTCAFEDEAGPADVLSRTARTLEGQLDSFVSLFYGVYDAGTQTLTYACAGHEPPILLDAVGGTPVALKPTGPVLGVGLSEFRQISLPLPPGGTLIFVTDGLTEVRRPSGEMLDWEGLAGIAARQAARTDDAGCLADGLLDDVRAWAGRTHLSDDVALLVARVGPYASV